MPIDRGSRNLLEWAGDDRVTLAIVFTDIVDSTKLNDRLGDQRMNKVRSAHFRQSDKLLEKFRGRQVKTIGDSVIAVFHSVGSAFDYACALHRDPGDVELRARGVRAGIHTGEVDIVGEDIFGSDVNFTARVEGAAKNAEIWVSASALEAIRRRGAAHHQNLKWQPHDNLEIKGFGESIRYGR